MQVLHEHFIFCQYIILYYMKEMTNDIWMWLF
jgi:hypothetical protein